MPGSKVIQVCVQNYWQGVVVTVVILQKHRLGEEVICEAVKKHFKKHHAVAQSINEDGFLKWCSKIAAAISNMCMKFKRLYTPSE